MLRLTAIALLTLVLVAGPAGTGRADEALQGELHALVERHLASARLGNLAGAMALASRATAERWNRERGAAAAELARVALDSFEPAALIVEKPGQEASLYGVGRRLGSRIEMAAYLVVEDGAWRIQGLELFADPDRVEAAPDLDPEPIDAWDPAAIVPLHGRIVWARQLDEEVLAVLRVTVDQAGAPSQAYDVAVYLPRPDLLAQIGLPLDSLVPWTWLSVEGARHRTKPLKVLATRVSR